MVTKGGRLLSFAQAKVLHYALNVDMAGLTGGWIGAAICHLGQLVQLENGSAALRIFTDARLVSDSWTGTYDGETEDWLAGRFAGIAVVFEKIRALLPVLDRIPAR